MRLSFSPLICHKIARMSYITGRSEYDRNAMFSHMPIMFITQLSIKSTGFPFRSQKPPNGNPTVVEHVSSYFLTDIDFTKLLSNDCKTVGMDGFYPHIPIVTVLLAHRCFLIF